MKDPLETPPEPIALDELSEHPDVRDFFQADSDFNLIHTTSAKAERAMHHMATGMEWAESLARKAGLPSPDTIVASSSKKKVMLFSSTPTANPDKSADRIFGLITQPEASPEKLSEFITSVQ